MANKIGRIILWIVVIVGLAVVIYMILPGKYKNPLTAKIQDTIDGPTYKTLIGTIKDTTIPKNKKVTYDAAMKKSTEDSAWTYKKISVDDAGNGTYDVYCDGYNFTMTFEADDNDDSMITQTNAHVKLVFHVKKDGSTITVDSKEAVKGEKCTVSEVHVNETVYRPTDKDSNYFQKSLNSLAGAAK